MKTTIKHAFLLLAVAIMSIACNKFDIDNVFGGNTDAIEPLEVEAIGAGVAVEFLQNEYVAEQIFHKFWDHEYLSNEYVYLINSFDILDGVVNEKGESLDRESIDFEKYSIVFASFGWPWLPLSFDSKFRLLSEEKEIRLYAQFGFTSPRTLPATPGGKYYALIYPKLPDVKIVAIRQDMWIFENGSTEVFYKSWENEPVKIENQVFCPDFCDKGAHFSLP